MAKKLTPVEWIALVAGAVILAIGLLLFYTNKPGFDSFVQEDGIVEWLTVLGLLAGSVVCVLRFKRLYPVKSKWFLFVTAFLAFFLFFAAGEEISWGQRLIGIETPEYFQKHNAQSETNLHNLVVGGVKLNKLIFSVLLVGALAIYLIVVPVLYHKHNPSKNFFNRSGVPVARAYQVIGFVIVFGLTSIIDDGKRAELLECVGALLVFLIMLFPVNKNNFLRA